MDALIISEQELQWFAYVIHTYSVIVRFRMRQHEKVLSPSLSPSRRITIFHRVEQRCTPRDVQREGRTHLVIAREQMTNKYRR